MRYGRIEELRRQYPVAAMCRVLDVSEAGDHAWRKRPVSARALEEARLEVEIKAGNRANTGVPGIKNPTGKGWVLGKWWWNAEPNPHPSSEQKSVRKNTVPILDHLAEFVDIRPNWNIVRKRISILPSAPQSASRLALLGGLCVDNGYTSAYDPCICCVCVG